MAETGSEREIACQQVLVEDSSVFSIQWTVLPPHLGGGLPPELLLERYLAYIRSATLSGIRPVRTGNTIEFRFLGTPLLSFTGPIFSAEGASRTATLRICGGLLVQAAECHRGELIFGCEETADGLKIILQLADYCPLLLGSSSPSRLRKLLYRWTQAYIHRLVTVRFLARIWRELAGGEAPVRVVRASVRKGEAT